MGSAAVVSHVLMEDPFGVPLAQDKHMIEAVSTQSSHKSLTDCVRLRYARWCNEAGGYRGSGPDGETQHHKCSPDHE
jgi:hypothetical protein